MKKVMSLTLLLCTVVLTGEALAVPVPLPVPEPSTLLFLGAGVAGLAILRKKYKK